MTGSVVTLLGVQLLHAGKFIDTEPLNAALMMSSALTHAVAAMDRRALSDVEAYMQLRGVLIHQTAQFMEAAKSVKVRGCGCVCVCVCVCNKTYLFVFVWEG